MDNDKGHDQFIVVDNMFTAVFLMDMLSKFLTEQVVDDPEKGQTTRVRNLKTIAKLYLKRQFWIDLISVIPLQLIMMNGISEDQYLLLLKVVRMKDVPTVFSSSRCTKILRGITFKRAQRMISNNDPRAMDKQQNNTFIE